MPTTNHDNQTQSNAVGEIQPIASTSTQSNDDEEIQPIASTSTQSNAVPVETQPNIPITIQSSSSCSLTQEQSIQQNHGISQGKFYTIITQCFVSATLIVNTL